MYGRIVLQNIPELLQIRRIWRELEPHDRERPPDLPPSVTIVCISSFELNLLFDWLPLVVSSFHWFDLQVSSFKRSHSSDPPIKKSHVLEVMPCPGAREILLECSLNFRISISRLASSDGQGKEFSTYRTY